MENAELEFTEAALRAIAERAKEKDTGARGLRSIIEEVMLDIMFELARPARRQPLPGHRGRRLRPPAARAVARRSPDEDGVSGSLIADF